ncbi:MAG TPA: hypothetical protein VNX86_12725 [Rhizomicrobium sp.]|nr:hypothetical protein [Rhizomicrobium sp.]
MRPQIPTAMTAGNALLNPPRQGEGAAAEHLPSMPPCCRSAMPDQQIVIWTPARLAGAFFAVLRGALAAPRLVVSRTSADDVT